jgi:D-beta-D-heptose 7-phosphate kinase/D-beta-D-heptose 1-phosphate adenosyltransferase
LSQDKIKSLNQLAKIIQKLKNKKKKIIFTNGCFDILHFGHVSFLNQAKKKGNILVVGLNSDTSVKRLKGKNKPIFTQMARSQVLAALESVDFVTIFNQLTPLKVIKRLKPDILVKGQDWPVEQIVGKDFVELYGGEIITIPFIKGYSTRSTIQTIIKKFS